MSLYNEIERYTTWLVPRNESEPETESLRATVVTHIIDLIQDEIAKSIELSHEQI